MENHQSFAKEWIEAWNNHDIDAILSHYEDELEFKSPFIPLLKFNMSGVINSKEELKKYFEIGLKAYPDLKFTLKKVLSGVDSLVIYYQSVNDKIAAEVFILNSKNKAIKVYCHYL